MTRSTASGEDPGSEVSLGQLLLAIDVQGLACHDGLTDAIFFLQLLESLDILALHGSIGVL